MMIAVWIILGLTVGVTVGFAQGTRYCTRKMLPLVLAKMNPKELASVAAKASKLRGVDEL